MKTRQLQTTTSTAMTTCRSKQWDPPGPGIPCERERRHEMAAREREEQVKRDRAMAAAASAAQRVRQHRMISADRNQAPTRGRTAAGALKSKPGAAISKVYGVSVKGAKGGAQGTSETAQKAAQPEATTTEQEQRTPKEITTQETSMNPQVTSPPKPAPPGASELKADRLRVQLEELTHLPEQHFEQGFRQWLDQEGIAREMHTHLRTELINCFNNTALGQLLNKAAGVQMARSHALLTSPLAMALPTLVAEFLHSQNCHFTLSVFCSEMPHRHTLPKFENRPEFRFRTDELQQVLGAVLGGGAGQEPKPDPEFNRLVEDHYEEDLAGQTQSLLMALMRSLVEIKKLAISQEQKEKLEEVERQQQQQEKDKPNPVDCACQTEPSACCLLEASPEVDTSRLYQTEEQELILGADGRSVFVGPRVSQSLHAVEQQMADLMKHLRQLTKSCAPPVEVISEESFEQLIRREVRERDRLTKAGQTFNHGEPVIKLPAKPPKKKAQKPSKEDEVVNSELGPIILPAGEVEQPHLLPLHPVQFSSLAVIRQSLDNAEKKTRQPQSRMFVSVQRMETLMSDVSGCVQLLGNVLNLSMEQEHAVGQQKGFKDGYLEGFGHGHFMGVQEGRLREQHDRSKNNKETATQVHVSTRSKATQVNRRRTLGPKNHIHIQTEPKAMGNAATQVNVEAKVSQKSYEQWIHEMLHSASGQLFLERVELSLNKALKLQKQRLDELYLVKLRHQAEMLRLSRRQNCWRTLCRRIERDSQLSAETQDIVQKIFRLLEHYEKHHQLLVEKIQQTELAAEQATCIVPMWTGQERTPAVEAPPSAPAAPLAPSVKVSLALPSPSEVSQPLQPAMKPVRVPPPSSLDCNLIPQPYAGLTPYPYQLIAVAQPAGIAVPTAYIPLDPRLTAHYRYYKNSESSDPVDGTAAGGLSGRSAASTKTHSRKSILPKSDIDSARDPSANSPETLPSVDKQPVDKKNLLPSGDKASVPATGVPPPETAAASDEPAPSKVSGAAVPASGSAQPLQESPTPLAKPPVKPSLHDVATNTIEPPQPQPILSLGQPTQGPSFEEALLSAKNRMKQLEEESDMLEQSFLSYLEKSKANTPSPGGNQKGGKDSHKPRRIPTISQLREQHEQLDRTLDSFMSRQRRIRQEDDAAPLRDDDDEVQQNQPPKLDSNLSSPLWLSELEENQDQDKYHFTNAISEARKKLLSEISLEQKVAEMEQQEQLLQQPSSSEWIPTEKPKVLSVVKPTDLSDITASQSIISSNDEMKLLLRRAKEALGLQSPDPLLDSSSDSSSVEDPALRVNRSPSEKLQQSMAKMELLFGGPLVPPAKAKSSAKKSLKLNISAASKRPLSAPTTGVENVSLVPPRPHTAPTLYPIQESEQQLPDISSSSSSSTSTSTSTTPGSLPKKRSAGGSFEELVASAVMGPDTTPEVSYSQEFWKRMNL